jgi:hypothetical protein
MSCRHQWAGAIIKGPVNHILVDQCEKCGKLRLQDVAPPAQGIDLSPIATRKLGELAAQGYVTNDHFPAAEGE